MVFHLKFPVWRKVTDIRQDKRRAHNGDKLRKRTDLSFLNGIDGDEEVLYEAQASCAVTYNQYKTNWVVWSLVDDCFEPENEDNESSLSYYEKPSRPAGLGSDLISMDTLELDDADCVDEEFDPLTIGHSPVDKLPPDPGEYFCLIWKHRAGYIWEEWHNTVDNLESSINKRVRSLQNFPYIPSEGIGTVENTGALILLACPLTLTSSSGLLSSYRCAGGQGRQKLLRRTWTG